MTSFETLPQDWLTVREAASRVLAAGEALEMEDVLLEDGFGRALAQDLLAAATLPPWDNSAMDGYAVRHEDLLGARPDAPVSLKVIGEVRAGGTAKRQLTAGEAIRIMTGAPVPAGADAIVRVEDTDAEKEPGNIRIMAAPEHGKDIRPGGQDMQAGEMVLEAGSSLGAGQIGLIAATGAERVRVHRRPRVAILSNGDEISPLSEFHRVMAGETIPETNGPTLSAAVRGAGGIPLPLGIARDNPESILEKIDLARTRQADVLVTSGGASMGEHDLFKRVMEGRGFQLDFWRVKMRPGTPFSFGTLPGGDGTPPLPVFGLPGNPASSFVTFQIFCRPFLLKLAGHRRIHRPVVLARAGEDLRSPPHLTHFFRVRLSGDPASPEAVTTGPQTSGLVRGQGIADGLAVVPEGIKEIRSGEAVRVILLDDFGQGGSQAGFLSG